MRENLIWSWARKASLLRVYQSVNVIAIHRCCANPPPFSPQNIFPASLSLIFHRLGSMLFRLSRFASFRLRMPSTLSFLTSLWMSDIPDPQITSRNSRHSGSRACCTSAGPPSAFTRLSAGFLARAAGNLRLFKCYSIRVAGSHYLVNGPRFRCIEVNREEK